MTPVTGIDRSTYLWCSDAPLDPLLRCVCVETGSWENMGYTFELGGRAVMHFITCALIRLGECPDGWAGSSRVVRLKSLLRGREFFGRQIDAWLAGSMLIGAVTLAIFGSYMDVEGDPVSALFLILLWLVFPLSGLLLSLLVHSQDPDGD